MATEKPETKSLIKEACDAYRIPAEHVVVARMVNDEAVIVTAGGVKVRYRKDQKVEPLSKYQMTGRR